jgi:hypothetical protein
MRMSERCMHKSKEKAKWEMKKHAHEIWEWESCVKTRVE